MTDPLSPTPGVVLLDGKPHCLEKVGRVDRPSMADTYWQVEGDQIEHPTLYLNDDPEAEELGLDLPDDPGWYSPVYRLVPVSPSVDPEEKP